MAMARLMLMPILRRLSAMEMRDGDGGGDGNGDGDANADAAAGTDDAGADAAADAEVLVLPLTVASSRAVRWKQSLGARAQRRASRVMVRPEEA
jgi:hypothetical protein